MSRKDSVSDTSPGSSGRNTQADDGNKSGLSNSKEGGVVRKKSKEVNASPENEMDDENDGDNEKPETGEHPTPAFTPNKTPKTRSKEKASERKKQKEVNNDAWKTSPETAGLRKAKREKDRKDKVLSAQENGADASGRKAKAKDVASSSRSYKEMGALHGSGAMPIIVSGDTEDLKRESSGESPEETGEHPTPDL